MTEGVTKIQRAVESMHNCIAVHEGSVPVTETFDHQKVWNGVVEVFLLLDHPKAGRCYAWSVSELGTPRYVAVLQIPPVTSAREAVREVMATGQHKLEERVQIPEQMPPNETLPPSGDVISA